jgi:HEAT repeat protein
LGSRTPSHSTAYSTFVVSMNMDVDKWRDGIGFDIEALKQVTDHERDALVTILAGRLEYHPDWRPIEALGAIGTPAAIEAIRRALREGNPETRLYAAEQLAEMGETEHLDLAMVDALRKTSLYGGLSRALDLAEEHPSPQIQETLVDLALNGDEEQRIHCAALALFLGGKADEAFDWNHRPFFLQFGDSNRRVQIEAYKELCARLGVTPKVQ